MNGIGPGSGFPRCTNRFFQLLDNFGTIYMIFPVQMASFGIRINAVQFML